VQATARSFLMVLALLLNGNSFKHNHAADQITFFAILLASAAVDAISPLLGSLRALCGVFLGEFFCSIWDACSVHVIKCCFFFSH
jgi:hypothetical protein